MCAQQIRFKPTLLLAALALSTSMAYAAEPPVIHLQASASREVAQDLARASFYVEQEGPVAGDVQVKVNATMVPVVARLKQQSWVKLSTTGYQTYPVYHPNNGGIKGWRVRMEVQLESRDFAKLSDETANLSRTLNLSGIQFSVSRERQEAVAAELTTEAISDFQSKARQVAKAFGHNAYHLKEVTVGNDAQVMPRPVKMMRTAAPMAMAAAEVGVPMEAGSSTVSVAVSGSVLLDATPDKKSN